VEGGTFLSNEELPAEKAICQSFHSNHSVSDWTHHKPTKPPSLGAAKLRSPAPKSAQPSHKSNRPPYPAISTIYFVPQTPQKVQNCPLKKGGGFCRSQRKRISKYKPRAQATGAIRFASGKISRQGCALRLKKFVNTATFMENKGHIGTGRLRSRLVFLGLIFESGYIWSTIWKMGVDSCYNLAILRVVLCCFSGEHGGRVT